MAANTRIVEQFFANMTQGNVDEAFAVVSADVKWWVPGTLPFSGTKSKEQYLAIVGRIQAGFPRGVSFTIRGTTQESDRVAVEVESLGVHVNGKTYNNRYHFLFTIRDGKIVEAKEYMDTLHLKDLIS